MSSYIAGALLLAGALALYFSTTWFLLVGALAALLLLFTYFGFRRLARLTFAELSDEAAELLNRYNHAWSLPHITRVTSTVLSYWLVFTTIAAVVILIRGEYWSLVFDVAILIAVAYLSGVINPKAYIARSNLENAKLELDDAYLCKRERGYLLQIIRHSIRAVTSPRMFETERGYQGALLVELTKRLESRGAATDGTLVIEQEYQKRLRDHGLTIRPDIIIHQPFDPERHSSRREGNFTVIELKRRATDSEARKALGNLLLMMKALEYPLGVFINIDSSSTHVDQLPHRQSGELVAFAVTLEDGQVCLREEQPNPL